MNEGYISLFDSPLDKSIDFQSAAEEFIEDFWFNLTPKGRDYLNNTQKDKPKTMKKLFPFIGISFIIGLFIYFQDYKDIKRENSLEYDRSRSYHSGFKVTEENNVVITENIYIKNPTKKKIKFRVTALYSKDFEDGLVKEESLNGYRTDTEGDSVFELEAKTEKNFKVNFIGEAGSKKQKHDRNSPEKLILQTIEN